MIDICTIDEPEAAAAVVDPLRNRLLTELSQPSSAAGLAARLGLPRQRINYHLRELERLGLATVAKERKWGGLTERVLASTASAYVVSSKALGTLGADPKRVADRFSAGYVIALAVRLAGEVSDLVRRAKVAGKRLPTLSMDTVVCFRSPVERAEFTDELTKAVTQLVARYHDPVAEGSRAHRLVVAAHPLPASTPQEDNDGSA
jgi:DNA-binding transcriptional ArsR family regulator